MRSASESKKSTFELPVEDFNFINSIPMRSRTSPNEAKIVTISHLFTKLFMIMSLGSSLLTCILFTNFNRLSASCVGGHGVVYQLFIHFLANSSSYVI